MKYLFILLFFSFKSFATDWSATNQATLNTAFSSYVRGDTITISGTNITFPTADIANASYGGVFVREQRIGTSGSRCILRATTSGSVIFIDSSQLLISGQYVDVQGLYFNNGTLVTTNPGGESGFIYFGSGSRFCTLSNSAIVNGGSIGSLSHKYMQIQGKYHRIYDCRFEDKSTAGQMIRVFVTDSCAIEIDHCYFDDIAVTGDEVLTIGTGTTESVASGDTAAHCYIHDLLITNCTGDPEVISNKSSYSRFENITMIGCIGAFSFRQGHHNKAEKIIIKGQSIEGAKGFSIYGTYDTIRNSYVDSVTGVNRYSAITFPGGAEDECDPNPFPNARNILIDSCTFYNVRQVIYYGYNFGNTERDRIIINPKYVANIYAYSDSSFITIETNMGVHNQKFVNNFAYNITGSTGITGITVVDPLLLNDVYGVRHIQASSPVAVKALDTHSTLIYSQTSTVHPVQAADVGTTW